MREYGMCEACWKPAMVRVKKLSNNAAYGICARCEAEQETQTKQ